MKLISVMVALALSGCATVEPRPASNERFMLLSTEHARLMAAEYANGESCGMDRDETVKKDFRFQGKIVCSATSSMDMFPIRTVMTTPETKVTYGFPNRAMCEDMVRDARASEMSRRNTFTDCESW